MKRKTTKPVWPILLLVIILFVLSVMAPGEWRSVAIRPVSKIKADSNASTDEMRSAAVNLSTRDDRRARLPEGIDLLSPLEVRTLVSEQMADSGFAYERDAATTALDRFAVPRRVVEIGPPVTKQFVPEAVFIGTTPPKIEAEPEFEPQPSVSLIRLAQRDLPPSSEGPASEVIRRSSESTLDVVTHWPYPTELASQVEALSSRGDCAAWCKDVLGHLRYLGSIESLHSDEIAPLLQALRDLVKKGLEQANSSDDLDLRSDLGRAAHAIKRRLVIWSQLCAIVSGRNSSISMTVADTGHLREVVESLESRLEQMRYGREWGEYLLLNEAKHRLCEVSTRDTAACRDVAKRILLRMDYAVLTPAQHGFLEQPEISEYAAELRRLSAEPVDYLLLLDALERYENDGKSEDAVHIAAAQQILRWAESDSIAELGYILNAHYRNANVRIAISEDLVNRIVPATASTEEEINDVILGTPTFGRSETVTRLRMKLLPSSHSWRFALEALGEIDSRTHSSRGATTVYTDGKAEFRVEKRFALYPHRTTHQPAHAVAEQTTSLSHIETRLDPLPFVGEVSKALARRGYRRSLPVARSEAENKIASSAGAALDAEVAKRLAAARQRLTRHFHHPLQKLALNPFALEMRTTEKEAIARVRLAGYDQLAAYSPRPTAPEGSFLSVQIHESAMNNCIEQFDWQGQRMKLKDMYGEVGDLFKLPDAKNAEEIPDDMIVRFAQQDPLRVSFHDGRATLTLALAELSEGRKRWRNFIVRVHYRPASEQPNADLVRDSYVELIGRLGFRDQVALRAIFSRVFSRDAPIALISSQLRDDPRLKGLVLTQLAIGDGWIGIAIGPSPPPSSAMTGEHRVEG